MGICTRIKKNGSGCNSLAEKGKDHCRNHPDQPYKNSKRSAINKKPVKSKTKNRTYENVQFNIHFHEILKSCEVIEKNEDIIETMRKSNRQYRESIRKNMEQLKYCN